MEDMQGNFGFFNYFTVKKTDYLSDDWIWNHAFYLINRLQSVFQHSGILAILYLVFLILQDMQFVRLFSNAVTIPYLLSIPIFCGLLYKFRKRSWYHLLIPVGFMLASILLMRYQWFFVSYILVLVFISAVLVTVVICNNWYPVHKRIVLPILWSCVVGIPTLSLLVPYKFQNLFPPYVSARHFQLDLSVFR